MGLLVLGVLICILISFPIVAERKRWERAREQYNQTEYAVQTQNSYEQVMGDGGFWVSFQSTKPWRFWGAPESFCLISICPYKTEEPRNWMWFFYTSLGYMYLNPKITAAGFLDQRSSSTGPRPFQRDGGGRRSAAFTILSYKMTDICTDYISCSLPCGL